MVGILVSFWETLFSAAMLVSGRVPSANWHGCHFINVLLHIWVSRLEDERSVKAGRHWMLLAMALKTWPEPPNKQIVSHSKLSPTLQTSPSKNVGLLTHNKHLMFKISFPTQWRGTKFASLLQTLLVGYGDREWRFKTQNRQTQGCIFFGWQVSTVIEQDCDK